MYYISVWGSAFSYMYSCEKLAFLIFLYKEPTFPWSLASLPQELGFLAQELVFAFPKTIPCFDLWCGWERNVKHRSLLESPIINWRNNSARGPIVRFLIRCTINGKVANNYICGKLWCAIDGEIPKWPHLWIFDVQVTATIKNDAILGSLMRNLRQGCSIWGSAQQLFSDVDNKNDCPQLFAIRFPSSASEHREWWLSQK